MRTQRAKVLHQVCGKPMVYYPVKRALESGADPVVVVVGHQGDEVEAALRSALPGAPLRFARQEEQLGTAHAVLAAKAALRGHHGAIVILSGDTPLLTAHTLEAVVSARTAPGSLAFATMDLENPEGYGRVVHAPGKGPALIVEEKDATAEERQIKEVNAGLYVADADFLWSTLARVDAKNAQREFYLTDLVALAADGPGAVAVRVSPVEASGVNDQEDLSLAIRALTRRIASSLMGAGVTIEDPERFDADEGVTVGPDTVIEPGVRLRGTTRIGSGCVIGQGCILVDTAIGDGVHLQPYCHMHRAHVGSALHRRTLRPAPPGDQARRGGPHRKLRGAEEDLDGQAIQGQPPHLPGRRHHRRGRERRLRDHHLQLRRRAEAPHPDRRRRLRGLRLHPGGAHLDREGGLRGRRLDAHRERPGRGAGAGPFTAGEQERLGPEAGRARRARERDTRPCAESWGTSVLASAWTWWWAAFAGSSTADTTRPAWRSSGRRGSRSSAARGSSRTWSTGFATRRWPAPPASATPAGPPTGAPPTRTPTRTGTAAWRWCTTASSRTTWSSGARSRAAGTGSPPRPTPRSSPT